MIHTGGWISHQQVPQHERRSNSTHFGVAFCRGSERQQVHPGWMSVCSCLTVWPTDSSCLHESQCAPVQTNGGVEHAFDVPESGPQLVAVLPAGHSQTGVDLADARVRVMTCDSR